MLAKNLYASHHFDNSSCSSLVTRCLQAKLVHVWYMFMFPCKVESLKVILRAKVKKPGTVEPVVDADSGAGGVPPLCHAQAPWQSDSTIVYIL